MKSCWFCSQKYVNDYHLSAAHTKAYHDLLEKIHEQISLFSDFKTSKNPKSLNYAVVEVLESLLEDLKMRKEKGEPA